MAKTKKTPWVGIMFLVFVLAVLAVLFTVDDASVIGEFLDPLEFAFMGAVGYYGHTLIKKKK